MKQIKITQMQLLNFKGVRSLEIDFKKDAETIISGKNGSGKTTIFDAFTWLMFGKDSKDRKAFEIKTLDKNGIAIPRIPHEVSATLQVNGEEIKLCRRYKEKWTKRKGQIEEEFTGHEEERLYNEVPCSLKEWNTKIEAICGEQVFKFITSPAYFVSQKTDVQRSMLFRMAGDISDEEIASGNTEFEALLTKLVGKDMEEYKREISAKKRRLKVEIEAIPERIDERKRDTDNIIVDFDACEKELANKKESLAGVEKQLSDIAEAYNQANQKRLADAKILGDLKSKLANREYEVKASVTAEYRKQKEEKDALAYKLGKCQQALESNKKYLKQMEEVIPAHQQKREKLIAEWKQIKALTIQFDENDFKCPTCGRPFEVADIEAKQQEMTERFNADKAEKLAENNRKGMENKQKMESLEKHIAEYKADIAKNEAEIKELQANPLLSAVLENPDCTPAIEADEECKSIRQQISDLEEKLSQTLEAPSNDELKEAKALLNESIADLEKSLSFKQIVKRNAARIADLEESLKTISSELAELEGIEFTMQAFAKARVEFVETRINSMFHLVTFKMYQQQINGGEIETCEAMINGVPYSSLNHAGQINAGLDIINAICEYENIIAPIFIDNCESIITPLPTHGQQIRLYVSDCPLTINC